MAQSTSEKEKFFAHLNSLDNTESDDDNSTQALEDVARKRRKLGHNSSKPTLHKAVTLPTTTVPHAKPSFTRASTDIVVKSVTNPIRDCSTSTVTATARNSSDGTRLASKQHSRGGSVQQHKGPAQEHKKETTNVLARGKGPSASTGLFQNFVFC